MKNFFEAILYQFYEWHLKYAMDKKSAAISAGPLLSMLIGSHLLSIRILISAIFGSGFRNFPTPADLVVLLSAVLFLLFYLNVYFVKKKKYLFPYNKSTDYFMLNRKKFAWLYVFFSLSLFITSILFLMNTMPKHK